MSVYTIEVGDGIHSLPCECCGNSNRSIWGYVCKNGNAHATYTASWTPGHLERRARFEIIIGEWGDRSTPDDRDSITLESDLLDENYSFMVIDGDPKRASKFASRPYSVTRSLEQLLRARSSRSSMPSGFRMLASRSCAVLPEFENQHAGGRQT